MENGKRPPLSKKVLEKLITNLKLTAESKKALFTAVEKPALTFKVPKGMSTSEYELLFELRQSLGALGEHEIQAKMSILALGKAKEAKGEYT